MKQQLKLNKHAKTPSIEDRQANLNSTVNKVGQPTIDSWFNKSNLHKNSFTTNLKTEPISKNDSTHRTQSKIPLVCLVDDSEENSSDKEYPPFSSINPPQILNNELNPRSCLTKSKKRGLLSSLNSLEPKNNSSLCSSVVDVKDSSDSDFEPDFLLNIKKSKYDKKRSSINVSTNNLLSSSIKVSENKKEVPLDFRLSGLNSSAIETKVSSSNIWLADSSIENFQKPLKANVNHDGKIKSELSSFKKKVDLLSFKSLPKTTSSPISKISHSQIISPFLETRNNEYCQVAKKEKNPRSPFKQIERTSLIPKQEKLSYCGSPVNPKPTIQSPSEIVETDAPLVDTAVLDLFRQQFMGGKATRKKRIFSECQEEEILVVDLDRTEVLTIPTNLKKQSIPKKQSGSKKKTFKPRASREPNNSTEDSLGNNRRPTLKELYFRSKANGRYNKKLYSDLKQQHGYTETTRSKSGIRRKTFRKKKKT